MSPLSTLRATLHRLTGLVCHVLFALGGIILICLLGLTLASIGMRFFSMPIRGVVEISGYAAAGAIGLCLPYAQQLGNHIEVGMMEERLPKWLRKLQHLAISVLVFAFMLLAAAEISDFGLFVHDTNELIDGWNFSYDFFIFALALGCVGQALVVVDMALQCFTGRHREV